jgi:poly(hydroxyalkanoate) granule-associated protein
MAKRDSSSHRRRPRREPASRATSTASARASARDRAPADETRSTQQELLQGVQQVWLAGMGAIARAQKEGPAAFSDAVFEGLRLLNVSRSAAQRMVRDAFESAQATMQSRVGDARSQAQETWDGLETLFQNRVQRAMHQLGVPTAEEIRLLIRRVEQLNDNVEQMGTRERIRKPTAPKRRVAKSRTRRRTAARKSATE